MQWDWRAMHRCHEALSASSFDGNQTSRTTLPSFETSFQLVWTLREGKVARVVWLPTREEALEAAGLRE